MPSASSSSRYQRKLAEQVKKDDLIEETILKALMSQGDGRRWIWRLLSRCHIFSSSFNTDPLRMAALEGERNIGLQLLASVNRIAPGSYVEMMKENSSAPKELEEPEDGD